MALLDILKGTLQSKQPVANAAATPTASDLQNLQSVKATGKDLAPTAGPSSSNIAGQVAATTNAAAATTASTANDAAQNQLATTAVQQQSTLNTAKTAQQNQAQNAIANIQTDQSIANTQRGAKEQMATKATAANVDVHTQEMTSKYANAVSDLASQRGIAENDIFQDYNQSIQSLGVEKAAANIEQTAHVLAMSDANYVDTLKRVGAEMKLQDDLSFKREATTLAMQKNLEILSAGFDMERLINSDRRTFQEQMSTMDINMALQIATQAAKEGSATQMMTGGTAAVSAGAKAGAFDNLFSGTTTQHAAVDSAPTQGATFETPTTMDA